MTPPIPTCIQDSIAPSDLPPAKISREFRSLLADGARFCCAGLAGNKPELLLKPKHYTPRFKASLFETDFYFTNVCQIPELRFFVVYVVQKDAKTEQSQIFPRIFYKDLSLIWRSASHLVERDGELWIGKGDLITEVIDGEEITFSQECTTDLPLEMQTAVETILHRSAKARVDHRALGLVLRNGPSSRIAPYRDFSDPRRKAAENPRNLINRGKRVAFFRKHNDPGSLQFVKGFEPDFRDGIIEETESSSAMYGGQMLRFRILSRNRKLHYIFMAGRDHIWVIPPQATTTELSSYGVRTVDVAADDDLFVPGFEYHYWDEDEDPPALVTQIPEGFAGSPCPQDEARADASAWLNKLPIVAEFRRTVLSRRKRTSSRG